MNLIPDDCRSSILDITPEYLRERGLRGIILDIDNTLIGHNVPIPNSDVMALLERYRINGIKMCVVSNNRRERVAAFCEKIGVPDFVWDALKPAARGYTEAAEIMKLRPDETAAVGDQIFTDVWGARRAGCYAVLLKPIHKGGEGAFIAFKRILEKPILWYLKARRKLI
ncbi:MAG: YqeG family HAD IIIA-type phosphatase [Clostridia bacterium]